MLATSTVNTALSSGLDNISSIAATNLILILGFVSLLIAAGLVWRWVKKHIGKKI